MVAVPQELTIDLRAQTDPLIPKLVAALETIEGAGWWKVCRNEALSALRDPKLTDAEAREKAKGWIEHSLVGMPDTASE